MQKNRKHFDGEQEKSMASIDRLPDDILVHILSFMSTRHCVWSSILGKRWRFLWARVPNLKFRSWEHKTLTSFSNFFNRFVFTHKGHNINTFRFEHVDDHMEGSEYKLKIETLIATAIACNVQVIDIHSNFELMLPQCIFTCKTLVNLKLFGFCENNFPKTGTNVYLPALKKLKLRSNRYESEKSLEHLLSGCPVLEELTIRKGDAADANLVCVYVSSPTLTRLYLEIPFDEVDDEAFEVKLDTPALEHLKLHDYLSRDFSSGMLASLAEADVVFGAETDSDVLYSRSILEFVGKLNNVSCLKLTTRWNYCMEVPDSAFSALTIEFRNLTKLELVGDWRFVTFFLENSDNLEVLKFSRVDDLQYWMEPKQVPACLIYHLGTLRFSNFKFSEPEFNMVEYILRNAKVLKRMKIPVPYYFIGLEKKSEALKRISLFERASEACQLAFN